MDSSTANIQIIDRGLSASYTTVRTMMQAIASGTETTQPAGWSFRPGSSDAIDDAITWWTSARARTLPNGRLHRTGGALMFTEEHLQLFTSFRVHTFGLKIQEMLDNADYDDVSFEHKIVEAI